MPARGYGQVFPIALPWLLAIAAAGFLASGLLPRVTGRSAICGGQSSLGPLAQVAASAPLTAIEWFAMLAAMMPPLLALPVAHVWRSSLARRRWRALALFAGGYLAVWMAAGALVVPLGLVLRATLGMVTGWVTLAVALAWSASPASQIALNRCHRLRRIGALGASADRDCVVGGVAAGRDCAAACWPWMLIPAQLGHAALPAMALVTVLLFLERALPPTQATWRWPVALRLAVAPIRLRRSWVSRRSSLR